jgi:hypothetical protein
MYLLSGPDPRFHRASWRWAFVLAPLALVVAFLALPASARALTDIGVTQTPSARVVKPGGLVTFTIEVKNLGDTPNQYSGVYVELASFADGALGADAPYKSFSTTRGSCADNSSPAFGTVYHYIDCDLGTMNPGDTAQITATAQVNQSINHSTVLMPSASGGEYFDDNNSNNASGQRIAADFPPQISGSGKLKITGVPDGCVPGDFTIHVTAKGTHVKKVQASIDLGFDDNGYGMFFKKQQNGTHLTARIPASKIFAPRLAQQYKLHVKAKRAGRKPYEQVIAFTMC